MKKQKQYPSSKLLLSIAQKEYDIEDDRKKNLETRCGIYISLSGALLLFIANALLTIPSKEIEVSSLLQALPYNLSIILMLLALSATMRAIFCFIEATSIKNYDRFNILDFSKITKYNEDVFAQIMLEYYDRGISTNREKNDGKINGFRQGINHIKYALIFIAINTVIIFIVHL